LLNEPAATSTRLLDLPTESVAEDELADGDAGGAPNDDAVATAWQSWGEL
jgi:hypothetical protein